MEQDDAKICALCKWNTNVSSHFYCSNPIQEDVKLKNGTSYNDTCGLFVEKEERRHIYDFWDQEINPVK